MLRRKTARFFSVLAILVLSSLLTFSGVPGSAEKRTSGAYNAPSTLDDIFYAVAKDIPEFAGAIFDEDADQFVVLLTKPSNKLANSALMKVREHGLFSDSSSKQVAATSAAYSFLDLKNWYDKVAPQILALPGVVLTDIDETSNRLRVGISDMSYESNVRAVVGKNSISQQVLLVDQVEPIMQQQQGSLVNRHRPLLGGLQIVLSTNDPTIGAICSLGFIARRGNDRGLVTNAHCTAREGFVDGNLVGQQNLNNGNTVAVEAIDPALFRNAQDSNCPVGRRCRYSDAAFASILAEVPSNQGRVARPATGSPAWDLSAQYVIDRRGDAPAGSTVERIGRTTGLSRGPVTSTCVDANVGGSDITMLCQWVADNDSAGGDSGGPVVAFETGNNRNLRGIHWGGGGGLTVFSPFTLINTELGGLAVCAVGSC